MNTTLSFRKESIQQSSCASAATSASPVALKETQGTRRPGDRWDPSLTTSLTTID